MPVVRPVTDLQRHMKEITDTVEKTGGPVYLTRNGTASMVLMDAATFDEQMALQEEVREREVRISKAIMRGYEDYKAGRVMPLEEALTSVDAARSERP